VWWSQRKEKNNFGEQCPECILDAKGARMKILFNGNNEQLPRNNELCEGRPSLWN
jgi:hypothetical protein